MGSEQNFFFSYDLNGTAPSHAEMDKHIRKLPCNVERVLETVWFIHTLWDKWSLYNYLNAILSQNDRVLLVEAGDAVLRNLLVPTLTIQNEWRAPLVLSALPRPPIMRQAVTY